MLCGFATRRNNPRIRTALDVGDYLFFEGMAIDCIIGLAEWERMVRQTVVLDLKVWVDIREVARKDRVDEGDFNTKRLSKRLREYVEGSQFQLIEALAENLAALVLEEFPVQTVELRLSKPGAIRGADNVGVVIVRGVDT